MMLEYEHIIREINITSLLLIFQLNILMIGHVIIYEIDEAPNIYPEYDGDIFNSFYKYSEYVGFSIFQAIAGINMT